MKIKSFEEIKSWQEARKLVKSIYKLTSKQGFNRDYGLKDQIQRASISIMANIAEGFDSGTNPQFSLFLSYAKRSASEVQSLLYASLDLKYISKEDFHKCYILAEKTRKLCMGFSKYLNNSERVTRNTQTESSGG